MDSDWQGPHEARRRAQAHVEKDEVLPWELWRFDQDVWEVRSAVGGMTSNLRAGLETSVREFLVTADPSPGLASTYLLQALVLSVLDEEDGRPGDPAH